MRIFYTKGYIKKLRREIRKARKTVRENADNLNAYLNLEDELDRILKIKHDRKILANIVVVCIFTLFIFG